MGLDWLAKPKEEADIARLISKKRYGQAIEALRLDGLKPARPRERESEDKREERDEEAYAPIRPLRAHFRMGLVAGARWAAARQGRRERSY